MKKTLLLIVLIPLIAIGIGNEETQKRIQAIVFSQISTPATNPSSGQNKVYTKSDNSLYILDSSGNESQVGSGTGAGAESYIESNNSNFENTVGDWVAYDDGASTTVVDATGGSPANVTCTRTTSGPLIGDGSLLMTKTNTADAQGEGCSVEMTIPSHYASFPEIFWARFKWEASSGYTGNVIVEMYDATNSTRISTFSPDSNISNIVQKGGGIFTPYMWQTTGMASPSNMTVRLAFHVTDTDTTDFTIKFDDILNGPLGVTNGTSKTDWIDGTCTGSWSTNTTISCKYMQEGQDAIISYLVTLSGAPDTASLTLEMPSGLVIDTTAINANANEMIAMGWAVDSGTEEYLANVSYSDSDTLIVRGLETDGGAGDDVEEASVYSQAYPFTWASGDSFSVRVRVPISGWSSNTQYSQAFTNRDVRVEYYGNSAEAITASTEDIPFITKVYDTTASWDNSGNTGANTTDAFTAPADDCYHVSGMVNHDSSSNFAIRAVIDGSAATPDIILGIAEGSTDTIISGDVCLDKGEVLSFRSTAGFNLVNASSHRVVITNKKKNSTLMETPLVSAKYSSDSGQTVTDGGAVEFEDIGHDTHAGYNTSTGTYTVSISGKYKICVQFLTQGVAAGAVTDVQGIQIAVNGTLVADGRQSAKTTTSVRHTSRTCTIESLDYNDSVTTPFGENFSNTISGETNGRYNIFTIHRIK